MTLSNEDAKLFYDLWMPLLDYVNRTCGLFPEIPEINPEDGVDFESAGEIAQYIWNHREVIDAYLEYSDLPEDHRNIVSRWKDGISGKFILERHLKKGSVFISTEDETVYLVKGIYSSFDDILHGSPVPIMLRATLLPFKDVIISDGLVTLFSVRFGKNYATDFKETYMTAKRNGSIKTKF